MEILVLEHKGYRIEISETTTASKNYPTLAIKNYCGLVAKNTPNSRIYFNVVANSVDEAKDKLINYIDNNLIEINSSTISTPKSISYLP